MPVMEAAESPNTTKCAARRSSGKFMLLAMEKRLWLVATLVVVPPHPLLLGREWSDAEALEVGHGSRMACACVCVRVRVCERACARAHVRAHISNT